MSLQIQIEIKDILSQISDEAELIESGKSTVLTKMPELASTLLALTDSMLTVLVNNAFSTAQKALYDSGDLTLDEVLSVNAIIYYNLMQRIKLYAQSLTGVIKSVVQGGNEIRISSNANNYTLTEDQFLEDENIINSSTNFFYYTILDGDTSRVIALREMQDQDRFIDILQLNDLSESDFIDGSLIGTQIKVPRLAGSIGRGDDNLVYESNPENVAKFLYGTDLASGLNKRLKVSATGDLLGVSGTENVIANIQNRVESKKGSLNVFSPGFGVIAVDDGNAPLLVKVERYLSDMVDQVQSDPRVESIQMDLQTLEFKGDNITVKSKIKFTGSDEIAEIEV